MYQRSLFIALTIIFITASMIAQSDDITQRPLYKVLSNQLENDTLIIQRVNGQKIKLIWPYRKNLTKQIAWKDLLESFQINFRKVADDVPDYKLYEINYVHNKNLVVNEVRGKEVYTVNEKKQLEYVRSNHCRLLADNLEISIQFNNRDELFDPTLMKDIEVAVSKVKHKFYFSNISEDRYYYSIADSKMLPNPKQKFKFFLPMGARIGLLKNKPYIELRPGLGLHAGRINYFSVNLDFQLVYDEMTNRTQSDTYLGFNYASLGAGVGSEIAFKISEGIDDFDDLNIRGGINYKTKDGITMGVAYYFGPTSSQSILWDFSLGFGF